MALPCRVVSADYETGHRSTARFKFRPTVVPQARLRPSWGKKTRSERARSIHKYAIETGRRSDLLLEIRRFFAHGRGRSDRVC